MRGDHWIHDGGTAWCAAQQRSDQKITSNISNVLHLSHSLWSTLNGYDWINFMHTYSPIATTTIKFHRKSKNNIDRWHSLPQKWWKKLSHIYLTRFVFHLLFTSRKTRQTAAPHFIYPLNIPKDSVFDTHCRGVKVCCTHLSRQGNVRWGQEIQRDSRLFEKQNQKKNCK